MSVAAPATTYAWIAGRGHSAVDPNVVGQKIEEIEERDGSCHPAVLVEEARPKSSELHPLFTWDDKVAAEKHRVNEARRVIASLSIVSMPRSQAPAFVSVRLPEKGVKSYISSHRLVDNDAFMQFALEDATRQLKGLRRRYASIEELEDVWAAIDEIAGDTG